MVFALQVNMLLSDLAGTASGVCLALAGILSIPHAHLLLNHKQGNQGHHLLPDNPHGHEIVTPGKSPRAVWQRIILAVVAVVGTLAAVPFHLNKHAAGTQWRTTHIILFAAWVLILCQELVLVTRYKSHLRYSLGGYSAVSCLALAITVATIEAPSWRRQESNVSLGTDAALAAVQLSATLILATVNLAIPRGPIVYRDGKPVDARDAVSFLSRYSYSWAQSTLRLAVKQKRLNKDDLPLIGEEVRARTLYDGFSATSPTTKLWKRCLQIYWPALSFQVVIQALASGCHFLPQFVLFTFLRQFEQRDAGASNQLQLWLTAAALGCSLMISSWFTALVDWIANMKLSLPVHEQLFATITAKVLRLKDIVAPAVEAEHQEDDDDDDSDTEDGPPRTKHSILNLLGVDVESISDFASYSHLVVDSAFELVIAIVFLLNLMGWKPTVFGCAIPVLMTPIYYYLTKRYSKSEEALMEHRDRKSSVLTEAVRGIRQIKFNALEKEWFDKIMKLRHKELRQQRAVFWLDILLISMWSVGPICMSVVSLVTYIYVNRTISASVAFTAVAIFQGIESTLVILPEMLTDLVDASVSARRIERFLGLPDYHDDRIHGDGIFFQKATITWPSDESDGSEERPVKFCLENLDFDIPTGELTVISGRSGAGKSLLLHSLIGETQTLHGKVLVPEKPCLDNVALDREHWLADGAIAYVSQDPWIENMTIRDAILFGLPLSPSRYNEVLEACSLTDDLKTFSNGDMTDIGANGINLSGGQKWRLAFARALYSRASILVLDDIFSAVDSHVGRHLYERALTGPLCNGRTRILATHHTQLCLNGTAYRVVLENGRVLQAGVPEVLSGGRSQPSEASQTGRSDAISITTPEDQYSSRRMSLPHSPVLERVSSMHERHGAGSGPEKYYEEEKRETGAVKTEVFKTYLKACGGYSYWAFIAFLFVLILLVHLAVPYWISVWTRAYDDSSSVQQPPLAMQELSSSRNIPTQVHLDQRLAYYVSIYVALSVASWLLEIFCDHLVFRGSLRASKVLFESFTDTILRAPLHFLDITPVGRILNRFTADFGVLDSNLAMNLSYMLHSAILVLGAILAALVSSPLIVGFGLLSLLASWGVASLYVTGARESKRLESIARSPIFDQVGSLLAGLATVRAFGRENDYLHRIYDLIDVHCQALWHRRLFSCWQSFWLSMVGAGFVTAVAITFVGIRTLDAPLAGFAFSFALEMSGNISWLLTEYAQLEVDCNAAERIFEYTELEQEPQTGSDISAAWPTKGEIEVTDLYVSYTPHIPPVLKGLTFSVHQGERIGIVGRTGAGKSSLSLALLRFLEPQSGSICIDGVNISQMRLHDVRSRLGIIPQDPVVFAGTIREVLDPFGRHDDSELLDALQKVSLASEQNTEAFSLTSFIAEGGKNLSQGQRQLLCLARAIVSRSKILIMDEATASVDMKSDARIQHSIREIHNCTLLVIAHRISTIADFDRILVMDDGKVVEFDRPSVLMQEEKGVFRALVEQSGEREAIEEMIFRDNS